MASRYCQKPLAFLETRLKSMLTLSSYRNCRFSYVWRWSSFVEKLQGPVSRKSRNFTGHFRVSQFPLYLKNGEDLSRQTSQSLFFLLP